MNEYRYLQEMAESGYNTDTIGDFHRICLPYLGERFFPKKDSTIIDLGAGWGHCLIPLKAVGYENLIAADRDEFARNRLEQNGISFIRCNLEREKLPFGDSTVDVAISFTVIAHLKELSNFFSEILEC